VIMCGQLSTIFRSAQSKPPAAMISSQQPGVENKQLAAAEGSV